VKNKKFKIKFVNKVPKDLLERVLYICLEHGIIVHKCACGCGEKTVTPLDKEHGWIMKYDGQTITLRPSIGNFSIPCKSHYYITENKIEWLESSDGRRKNADRSLLKELIKRILYKSDGKNKMLKKQRRKDKNGES